MKSDIGTYFGNNDLQELSILELSLWGSVILSYLYKSNLLNSCIDFVNNWILIKYNLKWTSSKIMVSLKKTVILQSTIIRVHKE